MDTITSDEARHIARLTHLRTGASIDTDGKPVSEVLAWLRQFPGDDEFRSDLSAEMDIVERAS